MSKTPILAPSRYSNRSEPARRGRIGYGMEMRARRTRSSSSRGSSRNRSRSASRNRSRSRSGQRSRSTSQTRRRVSVRFEEPQAMGQSATHSLSELLSTQFGDAEQDMTGISAIFEASVNIDSQNETIGTQPNRKKQRFRSVSVKRRSRSIFREPQPRRKREARAPSRSKSRGDVSCASSSIVKVTRRNSSRARSRSPLGRNQKLWLSSDLANCKPEERTKMRSPPLRLVASDDMELLNTHKRLQEEFGDMDFRKHQSCNFSDA